MTFCDNCGHALRTTAKFCGSCGTPITEVETTSQDTNSTYTDSRVYDSGSLPKPKSTGKAKTIAAGLGGIVIIALIAGGAWFFISSIPDVVEPVQLWNYETESLSKEEIKENYIALNSIGSGGMVSGYKELFRNNEAYVGKIIYFPAEVQYVISHYGDVYSLRLDISPDDFGARDMIWANWHGSRVLVGDSVYVYAKVIGITNINLVSGSSVDYPEVDILILNDEFHS